jgi:hypothetical protein
VGGEETIISSSSVVHEMTYETYHLLNHNVCLLELIKIKKEISTPSKNKLAGNLYTISK